MHYFFLNLLLYYQAWVRQTMYIEMMTKEGCTKILNVMTPRAGVLVQGQGHINHKVKMHDLFNNLLLYYQA